MKEHRDRHGRSITSRGLVAWGAALVAALGSVCIAQDDAAPATPPSAAAARLESLRAEYEAATEAFYAPLRGATNEEEAQAAAAKLDFDKAPARTFLPRYQELAREFAGTDAAAEALLAVVNLSGQAGEAAAGRSAAQELAKDYVKTPAASRLAGALRYASYSMGLDEVIPILERLEIDSSDPAARARAIEVHAQLLMDSNQPAAALAMLRDVIEKYPGSDAATDAGNHIFELEHLQVGMVAPDFEAVDQEGVAFKLSDYRGKVVVLDFWGFW